MSALSQIERNEKHRREKGLVPFSALIRPAAKELFAGIRQRNHITTAELFDQMIEAYQKQAVIILRNDKPENEPVIILQSEQSEQETVIILQEDHPDQITTSTHDAIDLNMPDRPAYALELLHRHGGSKADAMAGLKAMLQEQYPGFSADRNKNRSGTFAEPMKFYSGVSDFLGRYLKSQQS